MRVALPLVESLEERMHFSAGPVGHMTVVGNTTDLAGNRTLWGNYTGTIDINPARGTFTPLPSAGGTDIFVARYSPANKLTWARRVGGVSDDSAGTLAMDAFGNALLSGAFARTVDFDPRKSTADLRSANGKTDAFVWKLSPRGYLVYAATVGAANYDVANAVAADSAGNAYVAGYFRNAPDFAANGSPAASGATALTLSSYGDRDGFVWKISPAGKTLYANHFGGSSDDRATAISLATKGDLVKVSGYFSGWAQFGTFYNENNQLDIFELDSVGANDDCLVEYSMSGLQFNQAFQLAGEHPVV